MCLPPLPRHPQFATYTITMMALLPAVTDLPIFGALIPQAGGESRVASFATDKGAGA